MVQQQQQKIKEKKPTSRRMFSALFKIQVLNSYKYDEDCKGNQRATARKHNIHRRQIQKWLQMEDRLRKQVQQQLTDDTTVLDANKLKLQGKPHNRTHKNDIVINSVKDELISSLSSNTTTDDEEEYVNVDEISDDERDSDNVSSSSSSHFDALKQNADDDQALDLSCTHKRQELYGSQSAAPTEPDLELQVTKKMRTTAFHKPEKTYCGKTFSSARASNQFNSHKLLRQAQTPKWLEHKENVNGSNVKKTAKTLNHLYARNNYYTDIKLKINENDVKMSSMAIPLTSAAAPVMSTESITPHSPLEYNSPIYDHSYLCPSSASPPPNYFNYEYPSMCTCQLPWPYCFPTITATSPLKYDIIPPRYVDFQPVHSFQDTPRWIKDSPTPSLPARTVTYSLTQY